MIGRGPNHIDDRTPPMTPQLALRVAAVGGFVLILFAVLFFRLWFLQVLNSNQYADAAVKNVTRKIAVEAPRGELIGLNGKPLVESVPVPSVSISPTDLPVRLTIANLFSDPTKGKPVMHAQPARDIAVYNRLAPILGMKTKPRNCSVIVYYTGYHTTYSYKQGNAPKMSRIECLVAQSVSASELSNVVIKTGVSADVRNYIDERQSNFEGVLAQQAYQRRYLLGTNGAQLFGYVGPLTAAEVKQKAFKGVTESDSVGQAGLEGEYDQYLRGTDGYDAVKVNAENEFQGYGKGKKPTIGDNVKLSISPSLEKVGQASLAESIADNPGSTGGAFVAMDPQNGQVYAMGSNPTYKPSIYNHGISAKEWKYLSNPSNNYPLLNKAIQGAGPDGSTFKVITATAALESGVWSVDDTYDDGGQYCIPGTPTNVTGDCRHNSGGEVGGALNLISAFEMSDDDFFFNLGYHLRFNVATHPNGGALEEWARKLGLGEQTGVDLPNEDSGTVPTPKLFDELYKQQVDCEKRIGVYKHHTGACEIADTNDWTTGDDLNTALGQGDVQVTPLQLAVVYAAIENGGTVVTPHLAEDVQSADGTVIHKLHFGAKRKLDINPLYLHTIQQGLYYAAHGGYGSVGATSADVMGDFPKPVYGKTGTAQYGSTSQTNAGQGSDYAWYACYVPASATRKPIVVVVWVEKGGFGDVASAPVARQILHQWYYGTPGPYKTGTNTTL